MKSHRQVSLENNEFDYNDIEKSIFDLNIFYCSKGLKNDMNVRN